MLRLVDRVGEEYRRNPSKDVGQLSASEVANLIYRQDIKSIRDELADYLRLKNSAWILLDNIDKSWPTRGVQPSDIIILRSLLDATRNMERLLSRNSVETRTIVFVRNDVYEILVNETPDRGKESKVVLDWTDPELLEEMLRRKNYLQRTRPQA